MSRFADTVPTDNVFIVMRHSVRLDTTDPEASWADMAERPYDAPISNCELPQTAAEELKPFGIGVIVSSPFRRCLQTAGIVSRALGIRRVAIDFRLSEVMHSVRGAGVTFVEYLSDEDMSNELGDHVDILDINRIEAPPFDEDISDSLTRYKSAFTSLSKQYADSTVLCVSHGNAVEIYGSSYMWPPVLPVEVSECGFIASRNRAYCGSYGVAMLEDGP